MINFSICFFDAPFKKFNNTYFYPDICYKNTIDLLSKSNKTIYIFIRSKNFQIEPKSQKFENSKCIIYDYSDFLNLLPFIIKNIRKIKYLFLKSNLIYSDTTLSIIPIIFFRSTIKYILEIRNYTLFNIEYLNLRFNRILAKPIYYLSLFFLKNSFKLANSIILIDKLPSTLKLNNFSHKFFYISDAYIDINDEVLKIIDKPIRNILFVGHLEKIKRVEWLLEILKEYQNLSLTIIGDGPEYKNLKSIVFNNYLEKRVFFVGRINDKLKLKDYYIKSDLLLISSFTETGPRVILEATLYGLLVYTTNVGSIAPLLHKKSVSESNSFSSYSKGLFNLISSDIHQLNEILNYNKEILKNFEVNYLLNQRFNILK